MTIGNDATYNTSDAMSALPLEHIAPTDPRGGFTDTGEASVAGFGIGATIHHSASGATYWASVEFSHLFCQPSPIVACSDGNNWTDVDPKLDPEPPQRRGPPNLACQLDRRVRAAVAASITQ